MNSIASVLIICILFYFVLDFFVGIIQKEYALEYWDKKEPDKRHIYTFVPLLNIPLAIECWIKFGNPVATWELLENKTK